MSKEKKGTWTLKPNEQVVDVKALQTLREDQWAALLGSAAFKEAVIEIAVQEVARQMAARTGPVGRAL